jgi:ADP-ribose pyrophosphatase YjhB (NUDIX family)
LLVFRHPDAPEAGIQVPAGTVEANERLENAVLREAFEETGLDNLMLVCLLGEQERDMSDFGSDEIHHRHFYHLRCQGYPPATWQHEERSPSDNPAQTPILFEFFWAALPHAVPVLIADHGIMLPQLFAVLFPKEREGPTDASLGNPALPNIMRLMSFNLFTLPSTRPLL